jgi:hypothetical protein
MTPALIYPRKIHLENVTMFNRFPNNDIILTKLDNLINSYQFKLENNSSSFTWSNGILTFETQCNPFTGDIFKRNKSTNMIYTDKSRIGNFGNMFISSRNLEYLRNFINNFEENFADDVLDYDPELLDD